MCVPLGHEPPEERFTRFITRGHQYDLVVIAGHEDLLVCVCAHAGRGVRTNAGRRSSRSRQRHATDGVLTMTLRGDKVFYQLLYNLLCNSVCKPSCKTCLCKSICTLFWTPFCARVCRRICAPFYLPLLHATNAFVCIRRLQTSVRIVQQTGFPTGIQSSLCRRDCRTLRTPVARRVCRPSFRPP